MTTTVLHSPEPLPAAPEQPSRPRRKGWFAALMLRLHFYVGIFIGPFILIAALTGAAYAVAPTIDRIMFGHLLHVQPSEQNVPLADQVTAATDHVARTHSGDTIRSVRPALEPGATTAVLFNEDGTIPWQNRHVFIDPGTGEVLGDELVMDTSFAVGTFLDQLHRTLFLGDVGRYYGELAASWLGITSLAGFVLWLTRRRRARNKRELVVPNVKATGYRRLFSWHASVGVWVLLGALFLSATGITWSQLAGANVSTFRQAISWETPYVNTALADSAGSGGGGHEHHGGDTSTPSEVGEISPAAFETMLAIGQRHNIDATQVEISVPAGSGQGWTVAEIRKELPTQVDTIAIDGRTLDLIDQVNFSDYPVGAKLARWGIDAHMGVMGLWNQLLLLVVALSIATMVILGYLMWWKRRPTRQPNALAGKPPTRGVLRGAPWWGIAAVLAGAILIGWALPLVGYTLAVFIVIDTVIGVVAASRARTNWSA